MDIPIDLRKSKPITLHEFRRRRKPLRNINVERRHKRTRLDRLALWITSHVGTMGFFLLIFAWTVIWLGWNLLAPEQLKFDAPMGFMFAYLPTMVFYVLARRDVAAARALRDEARQCALVSEAAHARYSDAIVRAMQETAMQEREGQALQ
jgi:hypothetical protein